ncbi:carboxypeptidase-like regulatory domain-containing protein [Costertonia aggregata]|uniref:Carboxypeptidase-like regulatory domain-containing protein n=1 Tax=Costertonia aggregata TaxID=343403 RepID=A0A7H9AP03_9FLAO|nr:carboxypeptidase-like regulatory domain-containing protein [Costertonia aggregata]QLG45168.1 carboxypeptidase-like regulatory domain-containing protein [Costertonia aggregata]
MSYIITIPKPCHENWNEMTPTQKGAFCKSCAKEVMDFTHTGPYALAKKIQQGENICGRFKPEQLNTPLPSITQNQWKRNAIALGFTSLLAVSSPLAAQEQPTIPTPVHQPERPIVMGRIAVQPQISDVVTITGKVLERDTPLPGASVVLKDSKIGVKTDMDGNFSIIMPTSGLNKKSVLLISYLGFEQKEVNVNSKTKYIEITLEEQYEILGEIAIIEYKNPNIITKAKNLFQKKNRKE